MGLRQFKMPDDAQALIDIIPRAFQYPEHPEWSIDEQEKEDLIEAFGSISKIWWIVKLTSIVVPSLKERMLGFIWEEDGQPVGVCNVSRQGQSDQWMIGNVAVLPEYRRRGLARKLVQACVNLAIERGAEQIVLDVIDGNLPAYELYKSMGFVHYAGQYVYQYQAEKPAQPAQLPAGYRTKELKPKNWRLRYQLIQRVTPQHIEKYEPISEARYKVPLAIQIIQPLVIRLLGIHVKRLTIIDENNTIIGYVAYHARKNGKGNPDLSLLLDKNHAQVSRPIIQQLLGEIRHLNATGKVELILPDWQYAENELDPSQIGFEKTITNHRLGLQVH